MTDATGNYLRSTYDDVGRLPEHLRQAAEVQDRGEVRWPRELAEEAVRAIVGLSRTVQVLEYARYEGGRLVEAAPISTYEGPPGEDNLRFVLPGVPRLAGMPGDVRAVVCWIPGENA